MVINVPYVALRLVTLRGLQLFGYAPVANVTHSRSPAIDDLALAGYIPGVIVSSADAIAVPPLELNLITFTGLQLFGYPPIVSSSASITVEPAIDDLVLAGKVPTLNYTVIDPPIDTLVLAGQAPQANETRFTDVVEETLVLAGKIPNVFRERTIVPAERDLVLAGKVPTANVTHSASPAIDDIVLAGQVPQANVTHSASPAIDDLVLAGKVPVANVTHSRSPAIDDIVLAGKVPNVFREDAITPAIDDIVLAGKVPIANVTHSRSPAIDDLVLAGKAPNVFRERTIVPAERDLVLAGKVPTANVTHSAAPAIDDIVLAGKVPTAFREDSFTPAIDDLVLAGKVPVANVTHSRSPAIDDLVLAGQVPTVFRELIVSPSSGSLSLSGKLPFRQSLVWINTVPEKDGGEVLLLIRGDQTSTSISFDDIPGPPAGTVYIGVEKADGKIGWSAAQTIGEDKIAAPNSDSLTLSGKTPTLERDFFPIITEETLALAGQAPSLLSNSIRTPAVRPLVIDGQAPSLDYIIPVSNGALVLAGQAPQANETRFVDVAAETLVLAGQAPTAFREDSFTPAIDDLVLAGQAPVANVTHSAAPAIDALVLAGHVPNVFRERTVVPPERDIVLAGQVPQANETRFSTPAIDDLVLAGQVPQANETRFSTPAVDDLVLAGQAPVANVTHSASPAIDDLVLAGKAPTANVIHSRTPAIDDLVLAGQVPTLFREDSFTPAIDDLILAGQAPTANVIHSRAPAIDDIVLAGQIPGAIVSSADAILVPPLELNLITFTGLQLFGYPPVANVTHSRSPAIDDLVLAGQVPQANETRFSSPAIDDLVLAGQAPVANVIHSRSPAIDDIVLAGKAPTVVLVDTISAAEDTLVLAGQAPVANVTHSRSPAIDDLVLAGQAPTVERDFFIDVPGDITNRALSSEDFSTTWATLNSTEVINVNQRIAPDGTLTADQLIDDNGGGFSSFVGRLQTINIPLGTVTHSVFANKDQINLVVIQTLIFAGPTVQGESWFDLNTGTVGQKGANHDTSGIQDYGDGWYRCWVTQVVSVADSQFRVYVAETDGSFSVAKDGTSSIFIWGAQVNPGALTRYIKTEGSAVTDSILKLTGQAPQANETRFTDVVEETLVLAGHIPTADTSVADAIVVDQAELNLITFTGLELFGYPPTIEVSTSGIAVPGIDTLVLAGQVPQANETRFIDVAARALVLAGQAPDYGVGLLVGAGAITIDGQAPTANVVHSAAPAADTLVLAGQVPSPAVVDDTAILVGQAELNLISFTGLELFGYPPTLLLPTDHFAAPPAGTLTITGIQIVNDPVITPAIAELVVASTSFAAVTQAPIVITPPISALTLAGQVPTRGVGLLLEGRIPNVVLSTPIVNPDLLVLTGQPVTIADSTPQPHVALTGDTKRLLTGDEPPALAMGQEAEESSLIVEGWAPDVTASSPVFFPPIAPLVFTEYAPGVPNAFPLVRALALAGQAPTVAISNNLVAEPAVGAIVLAGQAPNIIADTSLVVPPVATLTLTGESTFIGRSITPAAVARNLNGKAPTVTIGVNRVITPAVRALSLAGQAPVSNIGDSPTPAAATLNLAGQAVTIEGSTSTHVMKPAAAALSLVAYTPVDIVTTSVLPAVLAIVLAGQAVVTKEKRVKKSGARTRLISLTVNNSIEILYR